MAEKIRISLRVKSTPVEIEQENGEVLVYTLKELTGPGRDDFLTFTSSKMIMGEDGSPVGIKDMKGTESTLLSLCLYDPSDKLVPKEIIETWPGGARAELFKLAQDLSGLGGAAKKALDKAKNS